MLSYHRMVFFAYFLSLIFESSPPPPPPPITSLRLFVSASECVGKMSYIIGHVMKKTVFVLVFAIVAASKSDEDDNDDDDDDFRVPTCEQLLPRWRDDLMCCAEKVRDKNTWCCVNNVSKSMWTALEECAKQSPRDFTTYPCSCLSQQMIEANGWTEEKERSIKNAEERESQ
ncbi:T. brucei spp.-specific protein [Trypanosoma brucei gambiense DAL972]|uniref:T. brucei spp.-specific protein n=2 Tax=Trypanozoon TaxID=39700 RepID=C9ZK18_TRYB9|nr:T. brucei spp.-specific protein [Trypanosoma brucei gambiense DAL972]CBH09782.1 T. brucei spp.-specific protein [Trypanosoma brucei gambiense DAL972]|eukprot:XP_011772075.1 T. brucei spp.-specific protein [Trypanosoma brucei gambiense DAL972]